MPVRRVLKNVAGLQVIRQCRVQVPRPSLYVSNHAEADGQIMPRLEPLWVVELGSSEVRIDSLCQFESRLVACKRTLDVAEIRIVVALDVSQLNVSVPQLPK